MESAVHLYKAYHSQQVLRRCTGKPESGYGDPVCCQKSVAYKLAILTQMKLQFGNDSSMIPKDFKHPEYFKASSQDSMGIVAKPTFSAVNDIAKVPSEPS